MDDNFEEYYDDGIDRRKRDRVAKRPRRLEEPEAPSTNNSYSSFIIVGLIMLFIGLFFIHLLTVITGASDDLVRWFVFFSQNCWVAGTLMISGTMMLMALKQKGLKTGVRIGLLIGGVVVLVVLISEAPNLTIANINIDPRDFRYW